MVDITPPTERNLEERISPTNQSFLSCHHPQLVCMDIWDGRVEKNITMIRRSIQKPAIQQSTVSIIYMNKCGGSQGSSISNKI